jgi:hypothetical protein
MEELINPSSTATATTSLDDIESIITDLLHNLLVQHKIPPIVEQEEAVIRRSPRLQQKNFVTTISKLQVQYPSQLPEFTQLVVHYMETSKIYFPLKRLKPSNFRN